MTDRLSPGLRRPSVSQTIESDSRTKNARLCSSNPRFASLRVIGPVGRRASIKTTNSSRSISTSGSADWTVAGGAVSLPPEAGGSPPPHPEMTNIEAASRGITAVGVYLLEMMFSDVIEGAGIKMAPRLRDSI